MFQINRFVAALAVASLSAGVCGLSFAQDADPSAIAEVAFAPFPNAVDASKVTSAQVGENLAISGTILAIVESPAPNVPTQLTLSAPDQPKVMVVYWQDGGEAIFQGKGAPAVGQKISAKGELRDYRGSLQIAVRGPEEIRVEGFPHLMASAPDPVATTAVEPNEAGYFTIDQLPALKAAYVNKNINFQGTVSSSRAAWSETAPNVVTISDEKNTVEVVFWDETIAPFDTEGTPIYVLGKLQEYSGKLQINAQDLSNLSTTPFSSDLLFDLTIVPPSPAIVGNISRWPGTESITKNPKFPSTVSLEKFEGISLRHISPIHVGNFVSVVGTIRSVSPDQSIAVLEGDGGFLTMKLSQNHGFEEGVAVKVLGELLYDDMLSQVVLKAEGPQGAITAF